MPRPVQLTLEDELAILNVVKDGGDRTIIIRHLKKVRNNTLGNWLLRLEKDRYILKIPKSRPCMYDISYKGRQRLTELRNSITLAVGGVIESAKTPKTALLSLDNFSVKYPIIKLPAIYKPEGTQMNGWIQQNEHWGNCCIRYNGEKSIEVQPHPLYGENEDRLIARARAICDSAAKLIQEQFGFVLGVGEINRDFAIELSNTVTKAMLDEFGYVRDVLDGSKRPGELNFTGRKPDAVAQEVQDWKAIPTQMREIREDMMYLREKMDIVLITAARAQSTSDDERQYRIQKGQKTLIETEENRGMFK